MEVIVIESEAFKKIQDQLDSIRVSLVRLEKKSPLPEEWLTNDEVLDLLKVSKRTLQSYRDRGEIAFSQIGSKIFYRASDIEDFLNRYHIKAYKVKK